MTLVEQARKFAEQAHYGQFRKYNLEPYINHPIRVALKVSKYTTDENVVVAAVLHDVVEDCDVSFKTIREEFGYNVMELVYYLTNPSKNFPFLRRGERKAIDRHQLAASPSPVQLIKVIDRIDNLKDMSGGPSDFKQLYARESLQLVEVLTLAPDDLRKELTCLAEDLLAKNSTAIAF